MTFERASIEQRLKKLRELVVNLREIASVPRDAFIGDYRHYWLAERGLQLAAENVLDIAHHILAAVFGRYPETNEEALDALRECEVISAELHSQLKGLGGLRNVLVHGYLDIITAEIYQHTQKAPDILLTFCDQVIHWMDRSTKPPGSG